MLVRFNNKLQAVVQDPLDERLNKHDSTIW